MRYNKLDPTEGIQDTDSFSTVPRLRSTDYHRIENLLTAVKTSESRLTELLKQQEQGHQNVCASSPALSNAVQEINQEATTLMATWELLKDTVDQCFPDDGIENKFYQEMRVITDRLNKILRGVSIATSKQDQINRGEEYANENTGNKNRKK